MVSGLIEGGDISALGRRQITQETCEKFGYRIGVYNGQPVQIAPYHDANGGLVAQHVRFPNKDFVWVGEAKKAVLWGQHLWREHGKMVCVTEGEIDAMTISQLQGNRWPVVSIKSGAAGAKKDIGNAIEWLEKFDSVVLCFDMDAPGKKAAEECSQILSPGKVKVWTIPLKDANEMLLAGREKELIDAIWSARTYRPDGIVAADDTWDLLIEDKPGSTVKYPWECLNGPTRGLRVGEIVTLCAGTGMGKSSITREIAHHLVTIGEKVGYIALEENVQRSIRAMVGIEVNRPIHMPEVLREVPREELRAAWEKMQGKIFFYDHWGSTSTESLLSRIRFLARGAGCRWVVLDHISIVVSGIEGGDERRLIDKTMTDLRALVEELQIGMLLISHLKRPEKKGHEEGAETHLSQLRGSAAIGQLSDIVLGIERNQQDEQYKNIMTIRCLKNRFTGETGEVGCLSYNSQTGRLKEELAHLFKDETKETNHDRTGDSDF